MATLKTDFSDGDVFYAGVTSDTDKLNGINNQINSGAGMLGEVRMFALSMTGAITKATLQGYGWAICDGTTPATQGISTSTIETTPNLEHKFIRMSNDDSSGTTSGGTAHNHQWIAAISGGSHPEFTYASVTNNNSAGSKQSYNASGTLIDIVKGVGNYWNGDMYTTNDIAPEPPYYEVAYFMKVKL